MKKNQHILLTGHNGYIGAILAPMLIKKAYQVTGLDTFYYQKDILGNYQSIKNQINHDIRRLVDLDLSKYDAIIHLAALSNDPTAELDPQITHEINHQSTLALAKQAKKQNVKRFIFSSSCSVYGISKNGIVDEKSSVNPLTEYAKSKILSEKALNKIADDNFCVVSLRNSTVYGYSPKYRNDLVVNNLTTCAYTTHELRVKSDGTPWRPLIDVRDLAAIFIKFLEIDSKKINSQIFNIGFNDSNYQIKDIIDLIQEALPACQVIYTGEHGSDSRSYQVNFDKLQQIFPNLRKSWPLKKSIDDLITELKNAHYSLQDFEDQRYVRLMTLKELIAHNKLDQKLFWKKN